jgi:hypothetical protein
MAAAPYFQQAHWDATFDLGIDLLFDAMEQSARRRGLLKPE